MRLRKVCPQCSTVIHAKRSICECGHAFTLKREARNTTSSPTKRKRALESLEDTLRRQENNRICMASMRSSETRHHGQYALCKCIGAPRVCTLVLFINPRRACARVTVLVLSVCLSVCVFSLFWHLAQSGVQTAVSATSARYGHEI